MTGIPIASGRRRRFEGRSWTMSWETSECDDQQERFKQPARIQKNKSWELAVSFQGSPVSASSYSLWMKKPGSCYAHCESPDLLDLSKESNLII
jgi:hypothetical protein